MLKEFEVRYRLRSETARYHFLRVVLASSEEKARETVLHTDSDAFDIYVQHVPRCLPLPPHATDWVMPSEWNLEVSAGWTASDRFARVVA